jgi:hypothetical protein
VATVSKIQMALRYAASQGSTHPFAALARTKLFHGDTHQDPDSPYARGLTRVFGRGFPQALPGRPVGHRPAPPASRPEHLPNAISGKTVAPSSQLYTARLAANPLELPESVLGFVPRPNVPQSLCLNTLPDGFSWPHPDMAALSLRYLAQPANLQLRARDYQNGLWQPPVPPSAAEKALRQRREVARQAAEKRGILDANAAAKTAVVPAMPHFAARCEGVDTFWHTKNTAGHNIKGKVAIPTELEFKAIRTLETDLETAKGLLAKMVADYDPSVKFSVDFEPRDSGFMVSYHGTDGTRIRRTFARPVDGNLEVQHTRFEAGETGGGSGKQLFRTSMGVYMSLGVHAVRVEAGLTVGGYAWARYGYKPDDWCKLRHELKVKLDTLHQSKPLTPSQLCITRSLLDDTNPYALWKLADASAGGRKIGKELLLGTNWFGTISLSDAKCMYRLKTYLSSADAKGEPSKKAGGPRPAMKTP